MMNSLKNSKYRNATQAIVVFMFNLRSGNSNNLISAVLNLERPQEVSELSDSESFEQDVFPTRFGIQAISRQYFTETVTGPIVKKLHDVSF